MEASRAAVDAVRTVNSSGLSAVSSSNSGSDVIFVEGCLERTWFNNELLGDELDLCPSETNSTEDDFNTFYFYQVGDVTSKRLMSFSSFCLVRPEIKTRSSSSSWPSKERDERPRGWASQ